MPRKQRSDSASAAIKAALDASKPLPAVPSYVRLRPEDLPFWDGILRARARDEWTESDLVVGAQLARCQRDIEVESLTLEDEGTVVLNDRGTKVANPRVSVIEQLARREMALMRVLRMGGKVAGDPRDLQQARKLQRQASQAREDLHEEDGLLA